jgi:hypothetical protein
VALLLEIVGLYVLFLAWFGSFFGERAGLMALGVDEQVAFLQSLIGVGI